MLFIRCKLIINRFCLSLQIYNYACRGMLLQNLAVPLYGGSLIIIYIDLDEPLIFDVEDWCNGVRQYNMTFDFK